MYLVIRINKRFSNMDKNVYESCFEPVSELLHDLVAAQEAKDSAIRMYPTGEEFIIIQVIP